jgi:hypothetical protein
MARGPIHRAREEPIEDQIFAERLTSLLEDLAEQGQYATRLAVHDGDCIHALDAEQLD